MQAITSCNIEYHPRGSGPPFGVQFNALNAAWRRIKGYGKLIRWVINGDFCLEMYLWCDTTMECSHTKGVGLTEDVTKSKGGAAPGLIFDKRDNFEVVMGPGVVISSDELIRIWWNTTGQFNAHPWDPNGIVTARRLGLTRQKSDPVFEIDDWDSYHATDEATFKAFDNGDFEREPQEVIWNRCNESGMQWL